MEALLACFPLPISSYWSRDHKTDVGALTVSRLLATGYDKGLFCLNRT